MFYHQFIDPLHWIQQFADRGIVVERINEKRDIFAHIAVYIIFFAEKLVRLVYSVGGKQSVEFASLKGFVEFFHSVGEETKGGAHEDLTGPLAL